MEPCNSTRDQYLDLFSGIPLHHEMWHVQQKTFDQFKSFSNFELPTHISRPKGTSRLILSTSTFLSKLRQNQKIIFPFCISNKKLTDFFFELYNFFNIRIKQLF